MVGFMRVRGKEIAERESVRERPRKMCICICAGEGQIRSGLLDIYWKHCDAKHPISLVLSISAYLFCISMLNWNDKRIPPDSRQGTLI